MPTSLIECYRCWRRCIIPASVYIHRPCVCWCLFLSSCFAHSAHGVLIRNEQLFCCPYVDRIRSTIVARASLSRIASDDITRTLIYEIYTRGAEFKGDQRNVFFHARQTEVTDESDSDSWRREDREDRKDKRREGQRIASSCDALLGQNNEE